MPVDEMIRSKNSRRKPGPQLCLSKCCCQNHRGSRREEALTKFTICDLRFTHPSVILDYNRASGHDGMNLANTAHKLYDSLADE